jgi:hypothetical protein
MKIAVPGTRCGGASVTSARKKSHGSELAAIRFASKTRPLFQVVITMKTAAAIASGNQPPRGILSRLADQNETSTARKNPVTSRAAGRPHRHLSRATTKNSTVVTTIVVVTATPYAAARLLEDRKPSTSPMHASISAQLTDGT